MDSGGCSSTGGEVEFLEEVRFLLHGPTLLSALNVDWPGVASSSAADDERQSWVGDERESLIVIELPRFA